MIAGPFRFEKSGGVSRFQAEVRFETAVRETATIHFDFHADVAPPEAIGDPWLAALLVPAMFSGEALQIRGPVSSRLQRTAVELQSLFASWFPSLLGKIELSLPHTVPTGGERDEGSTAVFFSGGVDSWYSAHRHRQGLGALITVKGFDIPIEEQTIWSQTTQAAQAIATSFGARLITVETNVRNCVDPGMGAFKRKYEGSDFWGSCYHGTCLDSVGLFLQEPFARVFVPASWQYTRLQPWGSHPLIECLLSNGRLQLIHDGAEASRMDKLRVISKLPMAMKYLRACPNFPSGLYNCGVCEKCRRTLLALRALGVEEADLPFSARLDLRALELNPPKPYVRPLYREILNEARLRNDADLVRCLRMLCGETWSPRYQWHRWSSRMKRSIAKRLGRAVRSG